MERRMDRLIAQQEEMMGSLNYLMEFNEGALRPITNGIFWIAQDPNRLFNLLDAYVPGGGKTAKEQSKQNETR